MLSCRFSDVLDATGGDKFSYNPCNSFSAGTCQDVAVINNKYIDNNKQIQCTNKLTQCEVKKNNKGNVAYLILSNLQVMSDEQGFFFLLYGY